MNNNKKTAIVIGATGLVGSQLVNLLLSDDDYGKIKIFVRHATNRSHPKLEEFVVDFETSDEWREKVKGDILFSAMGTTLKSAGSQAAQYDVDFHYQYNTAVTAATNGVTDYALISAIRANPNSSFFYYRMKGELEDSVTKLPFANITILQPGLLYGDRKEKRGFEDLAIKAYKALRKIGLMKNSNTIHVAKVAEAMIYASKTANGIEHHIGKDLFALAEKYENRKAKS